MILQALNGYYERLAARNDGGIAPPGYSYVPISFALVLSPSGEVVDVQDVRRAADKGRPRAVPLLVPQPPKRSGRTPPPSFLADKTGYVLGIERDKNDKGKIVENAAYQAAFSAYHRELLSHLDDHGARALIAFVMAWSPANFAALRYADELPDGNVVFRLDGVRGYLHDRPAIRAVWDARQASSDAGSALCLVTGEVQPIARLHASIKGVRGAQSSGASIVSFNQDAFVSFGKAQGDNAPVGERATFAYTTALNALLAQGSRQKIQIGDATTVYWAESDGFELADGAETAAQLMLEPPSQAELDSTATDDVRQVMALLAKGLPLESPELHLDPATQFYILGLAPNAARLSVRFWEITTLGALGAAFYQHWQDLRLDLGGGLRPPPSVASLVLRTAPARRDANGRVQFSFDDVSPLLAGELTRAILSRGRYPASLLSTLVMRLRTDGHVDRLRIALIKAILVRAMRLENRLPHPEYLMRTDPNDDNEPRRLGRLFALLERAQVTALGDDLNTTIRDKYLGAAAAAPGQVFVGLLKNAQHHTKRLRNGHSDAKWIKDASHARRAGFGIERDIGRLCGTFNAGFPQQHSIEEQGLFLVGYYQERFGGKPDAETGAEPGINTTLVDEQE